MTRNVKRFLAVSLLSLAPSVAFAEQYDFGDLGLFSTRSEYVSVRPETVEIPARRQEGAASLAADTLNTFYVGNWTGLNASPGYSLVGTPNALPPNPLAPTASGTISGYFEMVVPSLTPVTQYYYYTTNSADPTGAAKTCVWQVNITVTNGVCSASLNQAAYGTQGALCSFYPDLTWVDPATCQLQVVTSIQ